MSMTLAEFHRRKLKLTKQLEAGLAREFNTESLGVEIEPRRDPHGADYDLTIRFYNANPSPDYDENEVWGYLYDRMWNWYPDLDPEIYEFSP